jgi:hypothetical protein
MAISIASNNTSIVDHEQDSISCNSKTPRHVGNYCNYTTFISWDPVILHVSMTIHKQRSTIYVLSSCLQFHRCLDGKPFYTSRTQIRRWAEKTACWAARNFNRKQRINPKSYASPARKTWEEQCLQSTTRWVTILEHVQFDWSMRRKGDPQHPYYFSDLPQKIHLRGCTGVDWEL